MHKRTKQLLVIIAGLLALGYASNATAQNDTTVCAENMNPIVCDTLERNALSDAEPTCNGLAATIVWDNETMHSAPNPPYNGRRIMGTPGNDIIIGTDGDDVIFGLGGDDIICGGRGNDAIDMGNGNDWADGGDGNDYVTTDTGECLIPEDSGELPPCYGDDIVYSGPGDTVVTEVGRDIVRS